MGGHEGEANQGVLGSACRGDDGVNEDALVKGALGDDEGLFEVADVERDDRALGLADFETCLTEAAQGVVRDVPELGDAFGLGLDDAQGFAGRCRGRRGVRGRLWSVPSWWLNRGAILEKPWK